MFETASASDAFDAAWERTQGLVAKSLLKKALILQTAHKRHLSVANPKPHDRPSKPGEYPKARTFNLRDAVAIEPRDLGAIRRTLIVRVGVLTTALYGPILSGPKFKRKGIADTHGSLKAAGAYG
jgi:hypothetical protein